MAYVNFKNLPSEETPLTGNNGGNLNVMQENGTSHGTDTKLGYAQSFLNDHLVNVSNEVDEDYRVNVLKSKNLFDKDNPNLLNAYLDTNGKITSDANNRTIYISIKPNTTYTISKIASLRFRVGTYTTTPVANSTATNIGTNGYTDATATITSGANDYYLAVWFYNSNFDTENYQTIMNTIQIEIGSTATTYEPYITPSINVDNEEIYSKGVMTYSTSEINTGKKWINGKPIYRKVVQFNPSTSTMETKTTHNISNLSEILPTSSCILHRINNQFVPFSMFYPNTNQYLDWSIGWQVDNTHIFTWLGSSMRGQMDTSNYGAVAILEYTKTTD